MTTIFLTWQEAESRRWYPVGRLEKSGNEYQFLYTKGALESPSFVPFGSLTDLHVNYRSRELFPLFANRILHPARPEFRDWVRWLGFEEGRAPDALELLARSGGQRLTDSLQLYPCPERTKDGHYETSFFCHGLRYMTTSAVEAVSTLPSGRLLYPMHDLFNKVDPDAVALRTEEPAMMVGYCPRYLAEDIHTLTVQARETFQAMVQRVNPDAPVQFRLLCRITAAWPRSFRPCSSELFQPLANGSSSSA